MFSYWPLVTSSGRTAKWLMTNRARACRQISCDSQREGLHFVDRFVPHHDQGLQSYLWHNSKIAQADETFFVVSLFILIRVCSADTPTCGVPRFQTTIWKPHQEKPCKVWDSKANRLVMTSQYDSRRVIWANRDCNPQSLWTPEKFSVAGIVDRSWWIIPISTILDLCVLRQRECVAWVHGTEDFWDSKLPAVLGLFWAVLARAVCPVNKSAAQHYSGRKKRPLDSFLFWLPFMKYLLPEPEGKLSPSLHHHIFQVGSRLTSQDPGRFSPPTLVFLW